MSSSDASDVQTVYRAERGWTMPMVSVSETSFAEDMGYHRESGGYMPGISVFVRGEDGEIRRTRTATVGESDNYGVLWHLFNLLETNPIDEAGW